MIMRHWGRKRLAGCDKPYCLCRIGFRCRNNGDAFCAQTSNEAVTASTGDYHVEPKERMLFATEFMHRHGFWQVQATGFLYLVVA